MKYRVLKLSDLLPENVKLNAILEIEDYAEACFLVERAIVESLNEHVDG